jgi:plastocyanin
MKKGISRLAAVMAVTFLLAIGGAWAEGKVTITREENKPKDVEVKAGEEVRFINSSGQTAHVWFGGNEAVRFYVPSGSGGAKVKFDKAGTYEYTVHVSAGKTHSHTGTVVVK